MSYHLSLRGHPCHHGVMRPARALMLDASTEPADSSTFLQALDKSQHFFFGSARSGGNVRIGGESVGQILLNDAQYGLLFFGKFHRIPHFDKIPGQYIRRSYRTQGNASQNES